MSSQVLSSDVFVIRPRLDTLPRIHYQEWHASVFTVARNLAPGLDFYGALCLVATPTEWRQLRQNLLTAPVPAQLGTPEIPEVPEIPVSATNPVLIPGVARVPAVPPTPAQPATYRPLTDFSLPTPLSKLE